MLWEMMCHICYTNKAPSYYTPKNLAGVTMCPECIGYSVFMEWNPYNTFEETVSILQKIKAENEVKRDRQAVSYPSANEMQLLLRKRPNK